MKKTILLFIIFLALGSGTYYYLQNKSETAKTSSFGADRDFAVEDPSTIHKIFIAPRNGIVQPCTFVRDGDDWIYNEKYKANKNAIKNVLDVAKRVRVSYIAAKAAEDFMIKDLSANGIKVEFYDKAGKAMRKFYVGGMTNDETGTYMIMEGSDQPYVMAIPNWEGGLRARFALTNEQWRDRSVFSYQPEEIKAVSIEFPAQKNKSFKLEKKGDDYEVLPFYDITPKIGKQAMRGLVEKYLLGFESIAGEGFINNHSGRDSINQQMPFAIVKVTDTKDKTKEVRFHPIKIDISTTEPGTKSAVERYHINIINEDFMLAQHRVCEKIFWPYSRFFAQ